MAVLYGDSTHHLLSVYTLIIMECTQKVKGFLKKFTGLTTRGGVDIIKQKGAATAVGPKLLNLLQS